MPNMQSQVKVSDLNQPFPPGYRREGFPELMGWRELVAASGGRHESSVRQMRASDPDAFPEPVAVLAQYPIWLGEEVREYFAERPRSVVVSVTPEMHEQILAWRSAGKTQRQTAELMGLGLSTVAKWDRLPLRG